jgi:Nanos RNA binding domain
MSKSNTKSNGRSASSFSKGLAPPLKNVKPYCKVCHDAGKSESEYTSHFVRETPEPNSKVLCPTLLQQKCSYCSKSGHTVKYCKDALKAKSKPVTKVEIKKVVSKTPTNMFSLLYNDDTEETIISKSTQASASKQVIEVKEDFPALCSTTTKKTLPSISGYATIAAKSKADYDKEKYEQKLIETSIKRQIPQTKAKGKVTFVEEVVEEYEEEDEESTSVSVSVSGVYSNRIMKASAADCDWAAVDSDSDDEEDWERY